jgi:hypothetical protein
MHLNSEFMIFKGWTVADVGSPLVSVSFAFDGNGIDAGFGAQFIMQVDIGCGNAEQFAAAVTPGYDLAAYLVMASCR